MIFKMPQVGLVGKKPMDAQYMLDVNKRSKRLAGVAAVKRMREEESNQLKLPMKRDI